MAKPPYVYNDVVRVIAGSHAGREGCIVGLPTHPHQLYTVEFGDGSDAEIQESEMTLADSTH